MTIAKKSYSFRAEPETINVIRKLYPDENLSDVIREAIHEKIDKEKYELKEKFPIDNIDAIDTIISIASNKPYYSIDDVAAILNKPESTIREWCREGKLQAEKLGRDWHIHPSVLQAILDALRPKVIRIHKIVPTSVKI